MKWRIAKKIRKAVGTERQAAYTNLQLDHALNRYDRLKSSKLDKECWHSLMSGLGVEGRAKLVKRWNPAGALKMLVDSPIDQWHGDWTAWERFKRHQAEIGR